MRGAGTRALSEHLSEGVRAINASRDAQLQALEDEIRPRLIEEAKRAVARWGIANEFIFAMGHTFFTRSKAAGWYWPTSISLEDVTNERGPVFGKVPKYAHDLLVLAEEYGAQFGYDAFRVNKTGEVIYDW